MTALGDHATSELTIIGATDAVKAATITIVGTFADLSTDDMVTANHYINTLLKFLPLSPLTNNPAHWLSRSELLGGKPYWQSKRDPDAWSRDGGITFYRQSERGTIYTSDPS